MNRGRAYLRPGFSLAATKLTTLTADYPASSVGWRNWAHPRRAKTKSGHCRHETPAGGETPGTNSRQLARPNSRRTHAGLRYTAGAGDAGRAPTYSRLTPVTLSGGTSPRLTAARAVLASALDAAACPLGAIPTRRGGLSGETP